MKIIESKNIINELYYFCKELAKEIEVIKKDPMYFCSKLLENQKKKILGKRIHLFSGKKKIEFQNLREYNSRKFFIFFCSYKL